MRPDFSIFRVDPDRTPAQLRRSGFVLVPLGLLIAAAAAGMLVLAFGWQPPAAWLPAGTHIDPRATPWEPPISAVVLLSGILSFGGIAIAEGLWRIVVGRTNLALVRTMLVLVGIFFVAGFIASGLQGKRFGQVGQ